MKERALRRTALAQQAKVQQLLLMLLMQPSRGLDCSARAFRLPKRAGR